MFVYSSNVSSSVGVAVAGGVAARDGRGDAGRGARARRPGRVGGARPRRQAVRRAARARPPRARQRRRLALQGYDVQVRPLTKEEAIWQPRASSRKVNLIVLINTIRFSSKKKSLIYLHVYN